ncbi:MAG TPA: TonB-dependent receptor [Bryobacteraceae bacterium]|nr:TonB-dependent receptor [Bryobacteraceae bacterium]
MNITRLGLTVFPLLACITAAAQTTSIQGSIIGHVTDPAAAAVPGANVTATNIRTNISETAATDAEGNYRLERLLSGSYRLVVEHPNFKAFTLAGLTLSSAQTLRIQVRLELGSVAETIDVTAQSPLIETESPQISSVRPWEYRMFLPTRSADFFSTTALEPGATTGDPTFEVSFAGSRNTQYTYSVNGSTFRARPAADGTFTATFNEWQQEIKTSYVNNSAEYDVVANVNVTSKSGGNRWHGSGVEYYTSGGLKGRDPFSPVRPGGVNHVFAFSAGGPIVKNRAFFYTAYSGERDSSTTTRTNTVPTARMRQGDFSELTTPLRDLSTGGTYPDNKLPVSRIFPGSRAFLERFYPLPNFGGDGFRTQNYRAAFPSRTIADNTFTRLDWRISDRHSLFGFYNFTWGNRGNWYSGSNPFPEQIGPRLGFRKPQAALLSDTFVISPRVFNELNLGWTREHNYIVGSIDGKDALNVLGVSGVRALPVPGIPVVTIAGFTGAAQQSFQDIAENSYTIRDNVSWMLGRHKLKTGLVAGHYRSAQVPFTIDNFLGTYSFTNNFATNNALADFLLGYPQSVSRQNATFFDRVYRESTVFQAFVQDDFQVNNRLTLNLGLRYQYHQPFLDKNGRGYGFDLATSNLVVPGEKSLSLLNPLLLDAFRAVTAEQAGFPSRLVQTDSNNFAPRLGMAYRLKDNLVVRAGYGIYYDFNLPQQGNIAPYIPSESFPPNSIVNGTPLYRFPNPFPVTPNAIGSLNVAISNPSAVLPYTQQWSATVEEQVGASTAVRLSYTGTRTVKMFYSQQFNVPLPGTTPFTQNRRPYPQLGPSTIDMNGDSHTYHGLQAQGTYRGRNGLFVRSHYTLAKDVGQGPVGNPFDRRSDIGEISYIRRHQWMTEFNWALPFGPGKSMGGSLPQFFERIIGGWTAIGIFQAASGKYLTPTYTGYDASGTGILGGRPDRLGDGNLPSAGRTQSRWFDATAFSIPGASPGARLTAPSGPIGRFGNAGVGIIQGPGRWQFDMSLVKSVPLWAERVKANLFVLGTNLLNHPNLGDPALDITAPAQVGQITGIQGDGNAGGVGMRQIRLGVRVDF